MAAANNRMLDAALKHLRAGRAIVPLYTVDAEGRCSCGDPSCNGNSRGKHPIPKNWLNRPVTDEKQVRRWWSRNPEPSIGWRPDETTLIVDVDPRSGGDQALAALLDKHGDEAFHSTWQQATGGGGWHFAFRVPAGIKWQGKLCDGIDLKSRASGQVVLYPSPHYSGGRYECIREVPPVDAPPWLIEFARQPEPEPRPEPPPRDERTGNGADPLERARAYVDRIEPAISGSGGHAQTFYVAQVLVRGFELDDSDARTILDEYNARCEPPWSNKELEHKLRQARNQGRMPIGHLLDAEREQAPWSSDAKEFSTPGGKATPATGQTKQKRSKKPSALTLGSKLLAEHRFLFAHERLYVYRGGVYRPNGEHVARAWVQRKLNTNSTQHDGNELVYWLSNECRVDTATINTSELINVRNGLLDWRTGKLRPHSPDVLSTVQLPTDWHAHAKLVRGDRFLNEVLPDAETRAVVEEMAGYCLWPDCRFQKAAMLTGSGSNGKSVFIDWLMAMLGVENCSTLRLQDLDERFRTALLLGKLANLYADLPREAIRDTGVFKMLATGDALTGEWKHKEPFTFTSRAKLIFSANELPGTADRSGAFFRRWIVVEFPRQFAPGSSGFDEDLTSKLTTDDGRSYLLRLAVEGLRRLTARGRFVETEAMRAAVATYRSQADNIVEFTETCCTCDPEAWTLKSVVFAAYRDWCRDNEHKPVPSNIFAQRLRAIRPDVAAAQKTVANKRLWCWLGIRLVTDPEPVQEPVQKPIWGAN